MKTRQALKVLKNHMRGRDARTKTFAAACAVYGREYGKSHQRALQSAEYRRLIGWDT